MSRFESFTLINIEVNDWNGFIFEVLSFRYLGLPYSLINIGWGPGDFFFLEILGVSHTWI